MEQLYLIVSDCTEPTIKLFLVLGEDAVAPKKLVP
jgi:hypothetical protein